MEEANEFLRQRYLGEFNRKFTVAAAARGTAFRRCNAAGSDWIFTIQTERVVANDDTITVGDRVWQWRRAAGDTAWRVAP